MCSQFEAIQSQHAAWVKQHFDCDLPTKAWPQTTYPTQQAPFIFLAQGEVHCQLAHFGLVPAWARHKPQFGKHTYNVRAETVAEKPSYQAAWRARRFGLVLTQSFYEPCYETGRAIRTAIRRADGTPTAIACLWEQFMAPNTHTPYQSFSMLTVNADQHALMQRMHKPTDEKRSVVVIESADHWQWLTATTSMASALLQCPPPGQLIADFQSDPASLF